MSATLPFSDDIPPRIVKILRDTGLAVTKQLRGDREFHGLPTASDAECDHYGSVITISALVAIISTLVEVADWKEEEVEEAFRWISANHARIKAFGRS